MDQLHLMRRANGELFTLAFEGKIFLAVWPSLACANNYKLFNPELLVFIPVKVASAFAKQKLAACQKLAQPLFLLADTREARFNQGRQINWAELQTA